MSELEETMRRVAGEPWPAGMKRIRGDILSSALAGQPWNGHLPQIRMATRRAPVEKRRYTAQVSMKTGQIVRCFVDVGLPNR